jgi:murein L,D-transpeptidase YafK
MARFSGVALIAALLTLAPPASAPVQAGEFAKKQLRYARVKAAAADRLAAVEADFRAVGAAWPPAGVFIRGYKTEGLVELWAAPPKRGEAWVLVRSFEVCAASGALGPKRKQGDLQVPEGFYRVSLFNPRSDFHLSLGVSYPNAADRHHSRGVAPGNAIMVHGNCVTVGCLPLQDGPIEDLYLAAMMARDNGQQTIPIHLFPCRLDETECQDKLAVLAKDRPDLASFWAGLRPGHDAFAATGAPPVVRANRDGTYTLVAPARRRQGAS